MKKRRLKINSSGPPGETLELGKNRIEALSDGIFAVAMTLLILDFQIPKLPHNAPNVMVAPALFALWPKFVTYVVSFGSLGVFWVGHHNMYHSIRRADRVLLWLNILLFLFVACLPFSTSVLNAFPQTQIAPLFFGANLTIIGWVLFVQWAYASRQPQMFATFVTPDFQAQVRTRFLSYPIIATFTMLICFWSIPISLIIYVLLLPLYMIPGNDVAQRQGTSRSGWDLFHGKLFQSRYPVTGEHAQMLFSRKRLVGIVAVLLLIAGWAVFRPELLFVNKKASDPFPGAARGKGESVAVATGRFHGVAHKSAGDASIFRLPGGGSVLRLTHFQTSSGPDVRLYLIKAADATDNSSVTRGFIEVAKLKANEGDQNYSLPASLNIGEYHAVTVWCKRFEVNFATAPLKANPGS